VFFTVLGNDSRVDESVKALQHAVGFLRSELAPRMKLRVVPHLRFEFDTSVERGVRLSKLIDEAVSGESKREKDQ
jgi:ribosome-binding factor A